MTKAKIHKLGFSLILKFVYFQRERVDKKEIIGATVRNYKKHKIIL